MLDCPLTTPPAAHATLVARTEATCDVCNRRVPDWAEYKLGGLTIATLCVTCDQAADPDDTF